MYNIVNKLPTKNIVKPNGEMHFNFFNCFFFVCTCSSYNIDI